MFLLIFLVEILLKDLTCLLYQSKHNILKIFSPKIVSIYYTRKFSGIL